MCTNDHLRSGVSQARKIIDSDRCQPLILETLDLFRIMDDVAQDVDISLGACCSQLIFSDLNSPNNTPAETAESIDGNGDHGVTYPP